MKALHCVVALVFGLMLALQAGPASGASSDRVLTGEFVVTNAARNQFRLVEHGGSFTAPSGTAVEALDGKPVEVEIGSDGRVLRITQMPVRIEPIVHGFETISGEVVVQDPLTRRFSIAGDGRTFIAPSGTDVAQLNGRIAEVRLDEQGQVVTVNPMGRFGDAPLVAPPARPLAQCSFGDVTVASGSSICRSGQMFRCADGEWTNLGTACR